MTPREKGNPLRDCERARGRRDHCDCYYASGRVCCECGATPTITHDCDPVAGPCYC